MKELETYWHIYTAAKVVSDEPQTLEEALSGKDAAK
jgi:hypothetical protein